MRATERQIKYFFEQAGEVREVKIITDKFTKRSKGFAYIEMGKYEDVPKALLLNGQKMCLKHDACNCSGFPILVKASEAEKNVLVKAPGTATATVAPPRKLNVKGKNATLLWNMCALTLLLLWCS